MPAITVSIAFAYNVFCSDSYSFIRMSCAIEVLDIFFSGSRYAQSMTAYISTNTAAIAENGRAAGFAFSSISLNITDAASVPNRLLDRKSVV